MVAGRHVEAVWFLGVYLAGDVLEVLVEDLLFLGLLELDAEFVEARDGFVHNNRMIKSRKLDGMGMKWCINCELI